MKRITAFKKGMIFVLVTLLAFPAWFGIEYKVAKKALAAAPVVTVETQITNDQTPEITGTINDDNVDLYVSINGQQYIYPSGDIIVSGVAPNFIWTIPDNVIPNLDEGVYNVTATADNHIDLPVSDSTNQELTVDITNPEITTYSLLVEGRSMTYANSEIFSPNADGIYDVINIDLSFSEKIEVDMSIYDDLGNLVRSLYYSAGVTNPDAKSWDGKDNLGNIVTDGDYTVGINFVDLAGNAGCNIDKIITVDNTAPEISLIGDSVVQSEYGEAYSDLGASATDIHDGDLTANIVAVSNVDISVIGDYVVRYNVSDNAGNAASEAIREVRIRDTIAPIAPTITTISSSGGKIEVSWEAIYGAVNYNVFIGRESGLSYVANYQTDQTQITVDVLEYGDYYVRVSSLDISGNESVEADSLSKQQSVSYSAPVALAVVTAVAKTETEISDSEEGYSEQNEVTVDTSEVKEEEQENINEEEILDEDGQIKGEEETKEDEDDDINWTPWIILFILIILAGAATGGYFYWFADDGGVETKVKNNKEQNATVGGLSKTKKNEGKASKKRRW